MRDIGIDLGTTNTLIYVRKKGITLNEASMVAIDKNTDKIIAFGNEAKELIGRNKDNIEIISPIVDGVIGDFKLTESMLKHFIKKATSKKIPIISRLLISSPSGITEVEKNALVEIGSRLSSRKVNIIDEAKLALIGAGIDIFKATGSLSINIGGGITNIAILSLGEVILSKSIKIGGNTFDNDIKNYIKEKYKVEVGDTIISELKETVGSSLDEITLEKEIPGKNIDDNLPTSIKITKEDIIEAVESDIKKLVREIKNVLKGISPELLSDIKEKGIILTGGGSLIEGILDSIKTELDIPTFISDNPLTSVVEGLGYLIENKKILDQ